MWNKIDTLVIHSGFWVVNSDILYVETGGYKGQDSWLKDPMGRTKFLACSIPNMKCAIISNKVPYRQLIIFNNQYYRLFSQGIIKMKLPKVLEFPYKQTIPR
jgi:hypothetical protein